MQNQEIIEKTIAMRTGKLKMNREGEIWIPEELEVLEAQFLAGIPVNEIALELERSEAEVYWQIQWMQLGTAPSRSCGKRYSSFRDYLRFQYVGSVDYSPCSCFLTQHHFKEGYIDV